MILAILQARMSSTRLPGKVLMPMLDRPMLSLQLERVRRSAQINTLVVATSSDSSDDPIAEMCETEKTGCFRGSLHDVLDRYYQAALPYDPTHVVRLTGDCPLSDPDVIDRVIRYHIAESFHYTSNCHPPTFPNGLDVEVVSFPILRAAWQEAKEQYEREHVMPFIWQKPERFRIGNVVNSEDYSQMRWTVDHPEDYALVKEIFENLYPGNPKFGFREILAYVQSQPDLAHINAHFKRNESLARQLAALQERKQK